MNAHGHSPRRPLHADGDPLEYSITVLANYHAGSGKKVQSFLAQNKDTGLEVLLVTLSGSALKQFEKQFMDADYRKHASKNLHGVEPYRES